jgi:BirA family biotin operon repressor/biotin-[acetyl-CoA-carboxylase] ligase
MIPHTLSGLSCVERFYSYSELESTNTIAKKMDKKPDKGFFVIQADRLNSGSDQGSLPDNNSGIWVSIVVVVDNNSCGFVHIRALALAMIAALSDVAPVKKLSIKWPSDIYCNDLRIGGIHPEVHSAFSDVIVLGFGLNINTSKDELPENLQGKSTSLLIELGVRQSLGILLRSILGLYHQNTLADQNCVHREYSDNLYKKGSCVEIAGMRGIFDGVDSDGRFCLFKDGERILLSSGSPVFF